MNSTKHISTYYPVSIKGVIFKDGKVILLKNDREELGFTVSVQQLLDVWQYEIFSDVVVLIVTYLCSPADTLDFQISNEHKQGAWFDLCDVGKINMPYGYKLSILTASKIA